VTFNRTRTTRSNKKRDVLPVKRDLLLQTTDGKTEGPHPKSRGQRGRKERREGKLKTLRRRLRRSMLMEKVSTNSKREPLTEEESIPRIGRRTHARRRNEL